MKNKVSNFLIGAGVASVLLALGLFVHNQREAAQSVRAAHQIIPQLNEQIESRIQEAEDQRLSDPEATEGTVPTDEMDTVTIDGNAYIGSLIVPGIQLEMPILSTWSQEQLKITACRYTGTQSGDNLVVMGHNYARGFGRLAKLRAGDDVYFRDVNGVTTAYKVVLTDVLAGNAVEDMVQGDFDLTLFTCTYGGQNRFTVRCERAPRDNQRL